MEVNFDAARRLLRKADPVDESEVVQPTAPPPPTLRRLLFGDDGLRAGWSVLLYFTLVMLLGFGGAPLAMRWHLLPQPGQLSRTASGQTELTWGLQATGEALQLALFAVPAGLMALIERRAFSRYGVTARKMLPDFLAGLFWGFVSLSALVGALLLTHGMAFDGVLLHGVEALLYALKWALVFLLVGMFEEFFFRGYLQYTVSRGVAGLVRTMDPGNRHSHAIGFWVTAGVFSVLLFMLVHTGNAGETAAGIVAVGLAGLVFVFSLWRTGSLWWAIGMHAAWDWAQSYFYGTADSGTISQGRLLATHPTGSKLLSGGTDGPEGSVLVIPTLLLVMVVIHLTLPRRAYALTADQSPPVEPAPAETAAEAPPAI
jgi:membrane protease YdiL (CAAX protease family)